MSTQRPLDVSNRPRTRPTVTAIVPTYNRSEYLGAALDSILGQTVLPDQLIVVDDGSTDHTPALIAGYGDRVSYLRQANAGKASALNHALAHATGDAIWICDDDDIAATDALETLGDALAGAPTADFVFGNHDFFTVAADGSSSHSRAEPGRFEPDELFCALLERCFIFQGAMLVRRRLYDAVGPFAADLVRAQDYEMLLRLSRIGTGVPVPHVLFHQRQHEGLRGTADVPISGVEVWESQKLFDAAVLTRIYDQVALGDYLPTGERQPELSAAARIRALLRRGAVMARKKVWEQAGDDFAAAAELATAGGVDSVAPREAAVLRRVFDEWGYARDALNADNPLLRRVGAFPTGKFRSSMIAALTWPLFRYVLHPALHGEFTKSINSARLYATVTDRTSLARHAAHLIGTRLRLPRRRR